MPVREDLAIRKEAGQLPLRHIGGIDLHDVPDDRLAADLDHGLWLEMGFFADASSQTAGEDHCLHCKVDSVFL